MGQGITQLSGQCVACASDPRRQDFAAIASEEGFWGPTNPDNVHVCTAWTENSEWSCRSRSSETSHWQLEQVDAGIIANEGVHLGSRCRYSPLNPKSKKQLHASRDKQHTSRRNLRRLPQGIEMNMGALMLDYQKMVYGALKCSYTGTIIL